MYENGQQRFISDTSNSLFGRFLCEPVIDPEHFLVKLNEVAPWQRFTYKLVKYHRGRAEKGRPPCEPEVVLNMLLLACMPAPLPTECGCSARTKSTYYRCLQPGASAPL